MLPSIRNELLRALRVTLVVFVVTGLIYPFVMTGLAQGLFHSQANGGLVTKNGQVVGSTLIGQYFTSPRYFQGRPSATTNLNNSSQPAALQRRQLRRQQPGAEQPHAAPKGQGGGEADPQAGRAGSERHRPGRRRDHQLQRGRPRHQRGLRPAPGQPRGQRARPVAGGGPVAGGKQRPGASPLLLRIALHQRAPAEHGSRRRSDELRPRRFQSFGRWVRDGATSLEWVYMER